MYAQLLKWLGPWAAEDRAPEGVVRTTVQIASQVASSREPFEAWFYRPQGRIAEGALLVCPGVHYAGPADPRVDRFLRILAHAGIAVLSPFLPDFTAMRVRESVIEDLERCLDTFLGLEHRPQRIKPGLFSISFGSLPTLRIAAKRGPDLGEIVIFGGYADWSRTLRFCVGAEGQNLRRDPLNQPVVLMNMIESVPGAPEDHSALMDAWREYVQATWGRAELKVDDRHHPIAREVARSLPPDQQELFLVGCGVLPGAPALLSAALKDQGANADFLDPRPHLSKISVPVHLCHGLDDDVIPADQMDALREALPPGIGRTYLTGLYDHSGKSPIPRVRDAPKLIEEGKTLVGILRALVSASTQPAP